MGVLFLSVVICLITVQKEDAMLRQWQEEIPDEDLLQAPDVFHTVTTTILVNNTLLNSRTPLPVHKRKEDIDICFVTSVFSQWAAHADELQNVSSYFSPATTSSFRFFAFTNLPRLNAPGWKKVIKRFAYRRFVTHSRWPKFLAWTEEIIQQSCQVVFYLDAIGFLIASPQDYQQAAQAILNSSVGLAQYLHRGGGGPEKEFRRILYAKKDIPANVEKSKAWLQKQDDYSGNCTLYENRYIGYNVKSQSFQKASRFLWDHFSLEQDSWRDQPLWCYVLEHFRITPITLNHEKLFQLDRKHMGRQKHKYNSNSNVDAQLANEQRKVLQQQKDSSSYNNTRKRVKAI
jgi:hypothetical protein